MKQDEGLNGENVQHNTKVLTITRMATASFAGCVAGVLGLGWRSGFPFYFLFAASLAFLFTLKAGPNWRSHFTERSQFLTAGLVQGLMSFMLFWALCFNIVHIY